MKPPLPIDKELFKQSPALAVASHILGNMGKEEPTLADQFMAATYKLPTPFIGMPGRYKRQAEAALLQYRIDMRKAHRFVLDNEFTEYVTRMAAATAEKTLARLQYATLPYETTWIEFDCRVKVRVANEIAGTPSDLSDVPPRLGMLIQRINDTDAVCSLVSEIANGVLPHQVSYFFSTVERDFTTDHFGCTPFSPSLPAFLRTAALWGYADGKLETRKRAGSVSELLDPRGLKTPVFLERHGVLGLSRLHASFFDVFVHRGQEDNLNRATVIEAREFMGQIRWLVAALGMLNEVPVRTDHIQPSHSMRAGATRHNFVDYHKCTLRLPKTRPIPYLERYLSNVERKHRAHEVRGHWRTYLHEQHCAAEQHDWEYDHVDGYRLCGKCMAYGRFIHEHVRGDASLGWVKKDYVVKLDHQARIP
jgi:hypothetical protein